ncbi:hypothetical protein GQ43DRAFT_118146 [Delitschia confertaspora ATCC 74209]|uniref:Uncharacterized protein n=1 Tax=Delitschia confertaspora ATCC 74209 TaxID=1513339 RepID=A0A9P4JJR0_9PLEO|nr:hypothetical protein GQ43DRAFT_118146 [Delitschia confertaspora ATCC 74209]
MHASRTPVYPRFSRHAWYLVNFGLLTLAGPLGPLAISMFGYNTCHIYPLYQHSISSNPEVDRLILPKTLSYNAIPFHHLLSIQESSVRSVPTLLQSPPCLSPLKSASHCFFLRDV